jgi:prepilin-type N-terminal cleavage/methylation domain-containing protein
MSVHEQNERVRGFSLVEVMVALFLISLGVLAAAPMFIYAMQGNAVGADLGSVGAAAVERMELLRAAEYGTLSAGGNLFFNQTGYSDTSDPDITVRWAIRDTTVGPITYKSIAVRAVANRQVVGRRKQIILRTERAKG